MSVTIHNMLSRFRGHLRYAIGRGAARRGTDGVIELLLQPGEAASGGTIQVSDDVLIWCPAHPLGPPPRDCTRCGGKGAVEELITAWLTVRPGATTGTILTAPDDVAGPSLPMRFRLIVN